MQMNEMSWSGPDPIAGYGPGFFRIAGKVINGPVLTGPSGPVPWAGYDDTAPLLALTGAVDVLFIGTGAEVAHVPPEFRAALERAGIGVESMASPAACRTYNVLLSEGRRIALAALPV